MVRLIVSGWLVCLLATVVCAEETSRPRLIVLTDIGGDPDDTQSLVRLLVHSNEFDIEALIASAAGTPGELKKNVTRPEILRDMVEAYGQVQPNLALHADGFPTAGQLLQRIHSGNPRRGVEFVGKTHDTAGSRAIIAAVDADDPRSVNIAIWGGPTELAQALWRVRHDRDATELKQFLSKLRVYSINNQDDAGDWITREFPSLFYVLAKAPPGEDKRRGAYRGMYLGGDESLTSRAWVDRHVRIGHGPLGALYPTKTYTAPNPHATLKEGDTPSWFYFLPSGLTDAKHPEWGGWGGRFERVGTSGLYRDAADTVDGETDARATVWRWRPAFQNEFAARMDWCVKPPGEANHSPVAVVNGDRSTAVIVRSVQAGETIPLSAAGSSDSDRNGMSFRWWIYPELSTAGWRLTSLAGGLDVLVQVPKSGGPQRVHVILEVTDDGEPALTSYRRVILTAK